MAAKPAQNSDDELPAYVIIINYGPIMGLFKDVMNQGLLKGY